MDLTDFSEDLIDLMDLSSFFGDALSSSLFKLRLLVDALSSMFLGELLNGFILDNSTLFALEPGLSALDPSSMAM
jgi:hypothetical protein